MPFTSFFRKKALKEVGYLKTHKNFKKNFEILKGFPKDNDFSVNGTFSLVPIISPEGVRFACQVCKTDLVLQMTPLGSIMLSNVHRHISRRCWLQDNYTGVKGPKSRGIVKLFKGPSSSGSKKERGRDIISASRKKKHSRS